MNFHHLNTLDDTSSYLGKLEVEGTVTHKLDMRPHDCIEEYGKLLRVRNMKPVAENRHIQVLCCNSI